jgi:hypothetical protein
MNIFHKQSLDSVTQMRYRVIVMADKQKDTVVARLRGASAGYVLNVVKQTGWSESEAANWLMEIVVSECHKDGKLKDQFDALRMIAAATAAVRTASREEDKLKKELARLKRTKTGGLL